MKSEVNSEVTSEVTSRFQSLFHDFTSLPVTYVTIRSRVFKGLYLPNGHTKPHGYY